jgi:hypothetical protein
MKITLYNNRGVAIASGDSVLEAFFAASPAHFPVDEPRTFHKLTDDIEFPQPPDFWFYKQEAAND